MKLFLWFCLFFFVGKVHSHSTWFNASDPLTSAHRLLLEKETEKSFQSMVEAWQEVKTESEIKNLGNLLLLALSEDCGHSIHSTPLPRWLNGIILRRETIQTSNRLYNRFSILGNATHIIKHVHFSKWSKKPFEFDYVPMKSKYDFKYELYDIPTQLTAGLYKLELTTENDEVWSDWVIIGEPSYVRKLFWDSDRSWRLFTENKAYKVCPKPFLSIHVFNKDGKTETPIWSEIYENILPLNLPKFNVSQGEYFVTVSLFSRRWQGRIVFEDVQRISRSLKLPLAAQ